MSTREMAQLRDQIKREIQAMQEALGGSALVSCHDVIRRTYEQIGMDGEHVQQNISIETALHMMIHVFDGTSTWNEYAERKTVLFESFR